MKRNIAYVLVALPALLLAMTVNATQNTKPDGLNTIRAQGEGEKMILVVYYSRTGNTKRVAEDIAAGLNADSERIMDVKDRSGFFGLFGIIGDMIAKKTVPIQEPKKNPADYEMIILGTPVWGGTAATPVKTYIEKYKGAFKEIAYFYTSGSEKEEKILPVLEKLAGIKGKAGIGFTSRELKESKKEEYNKRIAGFISTMK